MRYCAWSAQMDAPDKDGVSPRAHLQALADRGRQSAVDALTPPSFPLALDYLWAWHQELRRGLGEGLHGLASLTWAALDAWARWTGARPRPHEVAALFALDGAARNPEAALTMLGTAEEAD